MRLGALIAGLGLAAGCAQGAEPFADVHLHYNWDQAEVTPPDEAAERLRANDVVLAVASGVPSDQVLDLREAAGDWVVPFFSPYTHPRGRHDWHRRPEVVAKAREALESGRYHGIGEVHFIAGAGPSWDNQVFQGLLDLAREYDVPVLIHTESSAAEYFTPVCRANPEVRFQWAHAGARLGPAEVDAVMAACPNVWTELSARDPWRYGGFADEDGTLSQAWRELLARYPDRFMTGADAVWPPGPVHRWDQADTGWQRLGQLVDYHRRWLDGLPDGLAHKIRVANAREFYSYVLDTGASAVRAE